MSVGVSWVYTPGLVLSGCRQRTEPCSEPHVRLLENEPQSLLAGPLKGPNEALLNRVWWG